ncbi:MAG: winged helix DNA-binding domain-containing protein [Oscillochloris sp.]|nr:winged helix DNA-binding domain-containing protein [Oscillochloris sp.]
MNHHLIGRQRLLNQQINRSGNHDPAAVVQTLGAMQAQDYLAALWAVGIRTPNAAEPTISAALAERRIVRTWLMRGTIHLAPPADVRWMLDLFAPKIVRQSRPRLRQLELDGPTLVAAEKVIVTALAGGRQATRSDLFAALAAAGIAPTGQRGYHILVQLAYAKRICFGPHNEKQPTFALLDEWIPNAPAPGRDEAIATLALRYFRSHGPAGIADFVWWSGLTVSDTKAALAAIADQLESTTIDKQTYYFAPQPPISFAEPQVFLLPAFDEFLIAYRDRSAVLDPAYAALIVPGGNGVFKPMVVLDGRISGTWQRERKARQVEIRLHPFTSWSDAEQRAIAVSAEQYGRFLGLAVGLSL